MMGDDLMVAPLVASGKGETTKKIYFPAGVWYDFFTGERIEGGRSYELTFPLDRMPLYVREGTLLPLARVTLTTEDPRSRELEVRRYGDPLRPAVLYEDDGSFRPSLKENTLSWDARKHKIRFQSDFYRLIGWE